MNDWLYAQARSRPDAVALYIGDARWTYRELQAEVSRLAARLAVLGLQAGQRVGLLVPSSLEAVLAIHAAQRLGLCAVYLDTRLTARELDERLRMVPCALLLHIQATAATALALETPLQRACLDAPEWQGDSGAILPQHQRRTIALDEVCAVIFTSGTSGRAKAAALTYGNFFASAQASAYRIGVLPSDRWLCLLPLYHVGGLSIVLRSCLYGTAIDLWPRFEVAAVNRALAERAITLVSLVPTMLHRLLEATDPPLVAPGLRLVLLGGAAASPELIARAYQRGIPVAPTYGMTEATSQVATMLPQQAIRKPGSVGRPLLFTEIAIQDEDGRPLPANSYGEIVVRGPTVMAGYLDEKGVPQPALRDGWLPTGDIGFLDADGDLTVVQRRSDLIVSGGENVYPAEVEQVLREHPAVLDVALVGVESPEWGQQVAAVLVLRDAMQIDAVLAWSRERLAGYKQPRRVRLVDALPRTENGKLRGADLRALFDADS